MDQFDKARFDRIRNSLNKINNLMGELKMQQQQKATREPHEIKAELQSVRDRIYRALNMRQFNKYNHGRVDLAKVTKSKKVLKLGVLEKLLVAELATAKHFHTERNEAREKLQLVHSIAPTGYELLRRNVEKAMGVEAARKQARAANSTNRALYLCKKG